MEITSQGFQPKTGWFAGWRMRAPAWPVSAGHNRKAFRTLRATGDLCPDKDAPAWSLLTGLTERTEKQACRLFSCGYQINSADRAGGPLCSMWIMGEGLIAGHLQTGLQPHLFAAEAELRTESDQESLDLGMERVVLVRSEDDRGTRFCLATGPDDLHILLDRAREGLRQDPSTWAEPHLQARLNSLKDVIDRPRPDATPPLALEVLLQSLRLPEGTLAARWSASRADQPDTFILNDVHGLAAAWLLLDPHVSVDLVQTALGAQRSDGSLPGSLRSNGLPDSPAAPWPLFCASVRRVWDATGDTKMLAYCLPRLERYLRWALSHFDSARDMLYVWPQPAEALVTETFDRKLLSVDLHAFLLREVADLEILRREGEVSTPLPQLFEEGREALETALQDLLWSEAEGCYRDRYIGGELIARDTVGTLMPLNWDQLPASRRETMLHKLTDPKSLRNRFGILAWQPWPDDPSAPPIDVRHQHLVLDALAHTHAERQQLQTAQLMRDGLRDADRQGTPLPPLLGPNQTPTAEDAPRHDTSTAALLLRVEALAHRSRTAAEQPPALRWLERHRGVVIGVPIAALVLIVAFVAFAFLQKKIRPGAELEAYLGLAQTHYRAGRFEEAILIYRDIDLTQGINPIIISQLANAHFQLGQYEEAEKYYRLSLKTEHPQSRHNLAQALLRQGEQEAARKEFELFLQMYDEAYPAMAEKVQKVLELMDEQQK